jgi:hypothetical protein
LPDAKSFPFFSRSKGFVRPARFSKPGRFGGLDLKFRTMKKKLSGEKEITTK